MFTVYVLRSESTGRRYIGQTGNLARRIEQHNDPANTLSKYTKRIRGPWICVRHESFATRRNAVARERELKTGKGREFLDRLWDARTAEARLHPAAGENTAGENPCRMGHAP